VESLYGICEVDEPDPKEGMNIADEEEPQLVKLTLRQIELASVSDPFTIAAYGWETSTDGDVMRFSGFAKPKEGRSVRFKAETGHENKERNTLRAEEDLEFFAI
jgi:hypothetical protein